MEEKQKQRPLNIAEEASQKTLEESTKKILSILQTNYDLKTQIEEKKTKLKKSKENIQKLVDEQKNVEKSISDEENRNFVLSKIKDYFSAFNFLQKSFTKREYESIYSSITELESMSKNLKQEKSFETIKQDSLQKMHLLFDDIVTFKEMSISFPSRSKFMAFNQILRYLNDNSFDEHVFNFLTNKFLQTMNEKNCNVKSSTLSSTPIITLSYSEEEHTPASFINESCNLLTLVLDNMSIGGFTVSHEYVDAFARTALKLGMARCGGREVKTTEATEKLCKLANIENVDIATLAQESRVPKLLIECREMFREGKVFGDAVSKMEETFQGTPVKGILTKITTLALVEWENEPEKLKMCFVVLAAVNTEEALKCMIAIQNRLNELKK